MLFQDTTTAIVSIVIIAHFLFGIGYLMYKLSTPSKKQRKNHK